MTLYKVAFEDRNGVSFQIFHANTLETVEIDDFKPIEHKLFSNDVFTYNKGKVELVHSTTRINENIPAVLVLADNRTYGRDGKRLLYKCIPDDRRIPMFLVPYEIKQLGFSKVFSNLYVTIRYKNWDEKHPHAIISQTIGTVDVLDNFYEYQLYCKSLNASIQKFNKDTNKAIKEKAEQHDSFITSVCEQHPEVEDRTAWKIFTIDPPTSTDFDDGFSIKKLSNNETLLSIYIANVSIWMDSLNLWSSFSQRISTIYLPDRKRPMLPTILSDCLCSLQQNARRFAFVMDITLNNECCVISVQYKNTLIKVFKNYAYEQTELLTDSDYIMLLSNARKMSQLYKYISNIRNSHDVVSYLMVFMNYHCAQELLKQRNGIFRSTIVKKQVSLPSNLPADVSQFIKIWNSSCGQYIDLQGTKEEDRDAFMRHDLLNMDAYIHITSPIRRLVDLLNMIQIQENMGLITLSSSASDFYRKWIDQLDYINTTMRSIRKVQNDCSLLDICFNDPDILDKTYDGYCFDKLVRNDGLFQFIVFLPELKLTAKITLRDNLDNYELRQYKLYLFNDEDKCKKKIRLHLV
jgi:exoribonuclease R